MYAEVGEFAPIASSLLLRQALRIVESFLPWKP